MHPATVVAAFDLTPRMRRVSIAADAMRDVELRPAQDVELHLREDAGRRVKRRYTISGARPERGEIDLDVLLHGDSPGSRWGATAAPGDEVGFQGPRGKLELRRADWHLLAGDESALPAIASICAALPADEVAFAFVEVRDADDELANACDIRWVHRGGRGPGTPEPLLDALERFVLPAGEGRAYLMGETRSMVALRALVEDRGVPHDNVFVKGYWNVARPDRIAGRAPR